MTTAPGYNDRFDSDLQVTLEERIAQHLAFAQGQQGDEEQFDEEDLQKLGRSILLELVPHLRPDLMAGSKDDTTVHFLFGEENCAAYKEATENDRSTTDVLAEAQTFHFQSPAECEAFVKGLDVLEEETVRHLGKDFYLLISEDEMEASRGEADEDEAEER